MRDAGCRPMGRLCCLALAVWMGCAMAYAAATPQSGPATTTISDSVFLADGTPAAGSLIITWPAFVTSGGAEVAAGSSNVTLGANGALSVGLVPNAGATPAGVYYSVVYQLGPGEVKSESWIVPASATPVNLATVVVTPGAGVAGQPVSMQYVNTQLAAKANDSAVVHLGGSETITGAKTFASAPSVPAPVNPGDVASKSYVDQSVSNVGAGNYLPTAGGTMTGPITLPGSPATPLQAATKQYVDGSLGAKADLVSGLVPASELGSGQATAGNCLTGNGTWTPCTAGGTGNLSTNPATSQTIAQPWGTQFSVNDLANIRYVTPSWNWLQSPTDDLSTPGSNVIHLATCPLGMDTTSSANYYTYKVYIAGAGTPEAAAVTGGSCAPGTSGGTITVTTAYPHAAGYTVGSASGGIQEAWNDAWTSDLGTTASNDTAPYVKLMAGINYNVYATVYLRGRGGVLDGAGALIACSTRDRCIYIGTTKAAAYVAYHKLYNLTGTSSVNVDGAQVASVVATSGTYAITTASNHPFVVGDVVDCEYYSQSSSQHWVSTVNAVPSSTSFTVLYGSGNFAPGANTFGFCGLLNAFIENNSDHVAVQDINLTQVAAFGMGYFDYGIVNDNDQQFIIERAANRASSIIRSDANFPMGAFVYQRTDGGNAGITYVHNSEFSNVNCATGGGNGFVMSDTVCQGFPVYGVRYFGGLQPATFTDIYQESTGATSNPLYGYAAQMAYVVQGGVGTKFVGTFPTQGYPAMFASGGTATNERTYFVVPRSSSMGYGPLLFAGYAQPATSTTNVTVTWPSIELQDAIYRQSVGTLTWDILVTVGQSAATPYGTGTYAIATNAAVSCGTNGMCSFTDTQAAPVSYTVQAQQFTPVFWFWPNNFVINNTTIFVDAATYEPLAVASQGSTGVSIVAAQCDAGGAGRRRSPIWVSCLASSSSYGTQFLATVLQELDPSNNGPYVNSKGRLNFGKPVGTPNDLITLTDSNFAKTIATAGQRPSNDAGDVAIGLDQSGGLSQRAGASISSYINVVPNGTNFLERLTATGKTVNVPLTLNGNLTVSTGTVSLPVTGTGPQCLHVSATGVVSGTGADCASGSGGSDPVTLNPGTSSQLAMYSGGSAVSSDSTLTDNGTTLNYSGTGGIAAISGTFSGNLAVNGQLEVAGPWMVSSPIPGTLMSASGPGTSSLGISDDGNFYISTNGGTPEKVATSATSSYFANVWQEDANDVGVYNGTTPQGLHVYSNYANSSSWQRSSLGYDATDNLAVVRSENSTPTSAPGLGFWIGSSVRWAISAASELKPFTNNSFNIGDAGFAPATIYAATSFDTLTQGRQNFELCNDGTTGTMLNFLAKYNGGNPACAVKAGVSDTDGAIGVVSSGSGITGNAVITYQGYALCSFDGPTVAGDYVVASTTNSGDCHDPLSAARPSGVQVLGRVESTNAASGTYGMRVALNSPVGSGGGSLVSPTFSGTVTMPDGTTDSASGIALGSALALPSGSTATTQTSTDSSSKVATTAYVQNQNYQVNTPRAIDASLLPGATVDVKLNAANALAITSGDSTIDARALGGAQTIAAQVNVGQLRFLPSALSAVSGTSPGAGTYKLVYTLSSPIATETSASDEQSITVTGSQAIQVASPTYYGTATSYNVYMTAAGGASWTETKCAAATNVAIGSPVTISAACSGAAVSLSNNGFAVSLIPPKSGVWSVAITDTVANASCGVKFFDQSSFMGDSVGAGRSWYLQSASTATNVEALACTDPNPKRNGYYSIRGLSTHPVTGDAIQSAPMVIYGAFDTSRFVDLESYTLNAGVPGVWVYNVGAATTVSGQFDGSMIGVPLLVGKVGVLMGGVTFQDVSAVHPGTTYPNVQLAGSVYQIHFAGTTYLEGNNSNTCADAIQMATGTNISGSVIFDNVYHGAYCSGTSSYLFSVPNSYYLKQLTVHSVSTGYYTNLFKYAPNTSLNISGVGTGTTYGFTMDNNNPLTVLTNFQVLGTATLGAGSALAGSPAPGDNSTKLATTAYVQAQGYAPLASPVLTGTPTAPTQSAGDNSTRIATTAYVDVGRTAPLATSFWSTGTTAVSFNSASAKAQLWGFTVPYPIATTKVMVGVVAADTGSCTYDIGILNAAGNIVVHLGNSSAAALGFNSTGTKSLTWASSGTAMPGKYYIAITASATSGCATLGASTVPTFISNAAETVSSSGTLNNGITIPADAPAFANVPTLYIQ